MRRDAHRAVLQIALRREARFADHAAIVGAADYILQVIATDLDACAEFVERVLRKPAGVSSIQSSLAPREVKFSSRVPLPDA